MKGNMRISPKILRRWCSTSKAYFLPPLIVLKPIAKKKVPSRTNLHEKPMKKLMKNKHTRKKDKAKMACHECEALVHFA